ncbi:MAG: acyl-CoA carboxylase subunit beta [Spirochaetaceae bacterium]|nr:acyl-CoA carboxylase subunit beta [Spirochaetaceae bacterium]
MTGWKEREARLEERRRALKERMDEQRKGRHTAYERLDMLLDPASFHEVGSFRRSHLSDTPDGDGVVTGYGTIAGRQVFVSSEDFSVSGGSVGEVHASRIAHVIDLAVKAGCPYIALNESGGARIGEGIVGLSGYGDIFRANVRASGRIPQIAVILGSCAGGACYSPALCDFLFMVKDQSRMFLTGPAVVKSVLFEDVSPEQLGGSDLHGGESGVAHFVYEDEKSCLDGVRSLLAYLPQAWDQAVPRMPAKAPLKGSFEEIVPDNGKKAYNMHRVIDLIVDARSFLEVHKGWAGNILTGFARLDGCSIGIVASQSMVLGGAIDDKASMKIARFVQSCDCYGIPLLTLVDVTAFLPGPDMERKGIIRHGAKVLYAYSASTMPKVTVILRKAYGGAYIALGSKSIGADLVYAWPGAEIAVLGAAGAVRILHRKEIAAGKDESAFVSAYEEHFCTPYIAAEHGFVDEVIRPDETREAVCRGFRLLAGKQRGPAHGNMPL